VKSPRNLSPLIAGVALYVVSNGQFRAPMATLFSALCLLVFIERAPIRRGCAMLLSVFAVAACIMWWGIIPAPGLYYFAAASAYGIAHGMPYVVHRALAPATGRFASTLVFPSAYVVIEALLDLLTPYGSWSSIGYAFGGSSGVAQLSALGGLPLVTFVIAWGGSALAWIWRHRAESTVAVPAVMLVGVAALVSLLPELRTRAASPPRATVTVATLSPSSTYRSAMNSALRAEGPTSAAAKAASDALVDDLLERSRAAARAGADLVVWSETAALMLKPDEASFQNRVAMLARDERVYIFAAYGTADPMRSRARANRLVATTPEGTIAWVYDKSFAIVGSEANHVAQGGRQMPFLDTPYGRVGASICHDADFPRFIRQARLQNVDLLLNPADDWPAILRLHANMAVFRAIENGVTLVRAAVGVSVIAGPFGNVLATTNSLEDGTGALFAKIPVRSTPTPSHGANVFTWLAVALLVSFTIRRQRSRGHSTNGTAAIP
jgi:apolipoprotein N-acyltransferase